MHPGIVGGVGRPPGAGDGHRQGHQGRGGTGRGTGSRQLRRVRWNRRCGWYGWNRRLRWGRCGFTRPGGNIHHHDIDDQSHFGVGHQVDVHRVILVVGHRWPYPDGHARGDRPGRGKRRRGPGRAGGGPAATSGTVQPDQHHRRDRRIGRPDGGPDGGRRIALGHTPGRGGRFGHRLRGGDDGAGHRDQAGRSGPAGAGDPGLELDGSSPERCPASGCSGRRPPPPPPIPSPSPSSRSDLGPFSGAESSVQIVTGQASGVTTVPSSAVRTVGARHLVTVIENGKTTSVPVTLGTVGAIRTQILSGVHVGETVSLATWAHRCRHPPRPPGAV